jgi:hypothetical protein
MRIAQVDAARAGVHRAGRVEHPAQVVQCAHRAAHIEVEPQAVCQAAARMGGGVEVDRFAVQRLLRALRQLQGGRASADHDIGLAVDQPAEVGATAVVVDHRVAGLEAMGMGGGQLIGRAVDGAGAKAVGPHRLLGRTCQRHAGLVDAAHDIGVTVDQAADGLVAAAVAVAHRLASGQAMGVAQVDGVGIAVDAHTGRHAAQAGGLVADHRAGVAADDVGAGRQPEAHALADADATGDVEVERVVVGDHVDRAAGRDHRAAADARQRAVVDRDQGEHAVDRRLAGLATRDTDRDGVGDGLGVDQQIAGAHHGTRLDHRRRRVVVESADEGAADTALAATVAEQAVLGVLAEGRVDDVLEVAGQADDLHIGARGDADITRRGDHAGLVDHGAGGDARFGPGLQHENACRDRSADLVALGLAQQHAEGLAGLAHVVPRRLVRQPRARIDTDVPSGVDHRTGRDDGARRIAVVTVGQRDSVDHRALLARFVGIVENRHQPLAADVRTVKHAGAQDQVATGVDHRRASDGRVGRALMLAEGDGQDAQRLAIRRLGQVTALGRSGVDLGVTLRLGRRTRKGRGRGRTVFVTVLAVDPQTGLLQRVDA